MCLLANGSCIQKFEGWTKEGFNRKSFCGMYMWFLGDKL